MNALLVCGSPRKGGNTEILLRRCADNFKKYDINSDLILLADKKLKPCIACMWCKNNNMPKCVIEDDDFNDLLPKVLESEIIILSSPVYVGSATAQIKMFMDRVVYVTRAAYPKLPLAGKIGAPIVVARRAGQNFTYAQLMYWYTINNMIVPGSTYWNIAFGREKGEVLDDLEALETIDNLCDSIAILAKKVFASN